MKKKIWLSFLSVNHDKANMVSFSLQFQSINLLVEPEPAPPPPPPPPRKNKNKKTKHKPLKLKLEKETHQTQGVIEILVYFNHFPKNGTINITMQFSRNTPHKLNFTNTILKS